jgi:peptidoglycan/LPS O-acetylase OafA/YrhL
MAPRPLGMPRFESLDHWRGFACLLVIIYHSTIVYLVANPADGGSVRALLELTHHFNVGVALFFVISGYCIAAAADNSRVRGDRIGTYFLRRFRRIYPPYWIMVVCTIAAFFLLDYGWRAPLLSGDPWPQYRQNWYTPTQWLGNLTLTETWRHHVFGNIRAHFPGQAWTLCYEEQFYFVTGILLVVSRRWFFPGIALVSVSTALCAAWARAAGVHVDGFFFDGSWLLFAVGVAVFYRLRYATGVRAVALDALLLMAIPLSLWLSVPIDGAIAGFAFAAALPWLYRFDRQVAASAALKPLLVCGQMCYSLYLVHQIPVKAVTTALYRNGATGPLSTLFVVIPVSVGVSVGLGWMFHVAVERRFLNSPVREPGAKEDSAPVTAPGAVGLPAGAFAGTNLELR